MRAFIYAALILLFVFALYLIYKQKQESKQQAEPMQPQTQPVAQTQKEKIGADLFSISQAEKDRFKNLSFVEKALTFNPYGYSLFTLKN